MKKFYPKSFATRLSVYIISLAIAIFGVAMWVFYNYTKERITERAIDRTSLMLSNMTNQIIIRTTEVETAVKNIAWMLQSSGEDSADSLSGLLRSVLRHNPLIVGSALAYTGELKMLYASRKGDDIVCKSLPTQEYVYNRMEWFKVPKETGQSHWSEPYFDRGGGDIFMCTFSTPLSDAAGNTYAVLTADISMEQFSLEVEQLKPFASCSSYLISRNQRYLTNRESNKIGSETTNPGSLGGIAPKYRAGLEALTRGSGSCLYISELKSYVFHSLIPETEWAIWSICPKQDMVATLNVPLYTLLILAFLGVVTLFAAIYYAIRRLMIPLTSFARSAKEIATGKFDVHLPEITSEDEMQDFRQALDYMQKSLGQYIQELKTATAIKNRMENELSIAREIQLGLLPREFPPFPERKDICIHALLNPAREVGGDLYGFHLKDNKLFIFIGDVSGKGLPAAIFMTVTNTLLKSLLKPKLAAKEIISKLNEAIVSVNDSDLFVTCFLGILDIDTGRLDFCNAGHNPPIVILPDGSACFLEVDTNLPVGVISEFDFQGQHTTLVPKSKLVLYTDGIVEAENTDQVFYSDARLLEVLSGTQHQNTRQILDTIEASVAAHVQEAPQSDDIAVLALEYTPGYHRELILENDLAQISCLESLAGELQTTLGISAKEVLNLRLALEETIVNSIMYGYAPGEKDRIHIEITYTPPLFTLCISDHGKPFDPTAAPEVEVNQPLEERPVGGLGIFLIRNLMDEVSYQRIQNRNYLTLKKSII